MYPHILLTDKAMQMEEKSISFAIDINHVDLDFIEAIDVTTIFGNLLDNAIEKYDSDIKMKNEGEMFIVDIFLNA